jgi:hypothetical protein
MDYLVVKIVWNGRRILKTGWRHQRRPTFNARMTKRMMTATIVRTRLTLMKKAARDVEKKTNMTSNV